MLKTNSRVLKMTICKNCGHGIKGKLHLLGNKKTLGLYDLVITDSETSKKDIQENTRWLAIVPTRLF